MSSLGNDRKQLLFDYSLGLTSESESAQAQALVSSNEEAAEIHRSLQAVLAPLASLDVEPCPDDLAERTISQLTNLANSGRHGLEELLAGEQSRPVTIKVGFWRNLVTAAAVILLVAGVLLSLSNRERHRYWKQRCQMQLSSIFQGLGNYLSDHDGKPPAVVAKPNQQWNTQRLYVLVKCGYVNDPTIFVCPARKQSQAAQFDMSRVSEYSDFPSREWISYSPRKRCTESLMKGGLSRGPILSDRNPIFDDWSFNPFRKRLDEALLRANSRNHRGRGQNVLFHDGRVEFITIRRIGVAKDDIFALQEMCSGSEVDECELLPVCETDVFLAP